jgi:hypothetical protein
VGGGGGEDAGTAGTSHVADAASAGGAAMEGPPALKNRGAFRRATIVPMVKLGCAPGAAIPSNWV